MIIICVDFDGTLCLGNKSHITLGEPNRILIERLKEIKQNINAYIKIVTARGSKNKLSEKEKIAKYKVLIENFCAQYDVPYDEISFNKEYADLYIDDMTINPNDYFTGFISNFTKNHIVTTDASVIKIAPTSIFENQWYSIASMYFNTPKVLFCNDSTLITEKIQKTAEASIEQCIDLLYKFKNLSIKNFEYKTYINNIKIIDGSSKKTLAIIGDLAQQPIEPTFFHGDFTRNNIIVNNKNIYLIDSNYKYIFGNYIIDAAKLYFSIVAYEKNIQEANLLVNEFGKEVMKYAVSEGLRVCKYNPNYISIVNNIAEML